jgi:hypothetical protein
MAKPAPPATASEPIDWPRLLIGRKCPPPGWWVDLAIQRQCGTVELRASAVVAILAPPLCLSPGRAPYLAQLPRLAAEWISLLRQHDTFICLGPDSDAMHTASVLLLTTRACCEAMQETRTSGREDALVPELWEMYREAGLLIKAMEAAGIPLESRHNRLSPEAKAELEAEVADIRARTGAIPLGEMDPTLPAARARPAGPAKPSRAAAVAAPPPEVREVRRVESARRKRPDPRGDDCSLGWL